MLKRFLSLLAPVCLFLAVFGFKLDLVHRYGSDLPRWDALDAEGLALYLPYLEGKLRFSDLFIPHNEHRIFWTKLLGLLELRLNGQWDARLQCVVNAALHSLIAAWLFVLARPALARRLHAPVFALIALLFALPLAWVNPIAGFHSQQYFLLGFSLGAIWLLPSAPPRSARWWAGALCTLAAPGAMGSGLFAAAVVFFLLTLQGWKEHDRSSFVRRIAPSLVVCLLAIILGFLGRVPAPQHDTLKAGSLTEFLSYLLHCLQWPAQDWSLLAVVLWAPVALLAWRILRRWRESSPFPLTLLGLAAWVLMQIAATAYTRGAGGGMPSSRYIDTLAFGVLVNGLALAWLWPRWPATGWRTGLAAGWVLALAVPAFSQAALIYGQLLPENRRHLEACEENVRRYLASGDARHLDTPDIPYPGPAALRDRLARAEIRTILPASVRQPLKAEKITGPATFVSYSTITQRNSIAPAQPLLAATPVPLPELEQRTVWFAEDVKVAHAALHLDRPTVLRLLVAGAGNPELSIAYASWSVRADLPSLSPAAWRRIHLSVDSGMTGVQVCLPPGSWIALAEPVAMARGSYWAWRLVRCGHWLWLLVAGLAALAGFGAWYCARDEKALG